MVAAVAADEPEIAAKMPQPSTLVCNKPPGSRATHGASPRNMSSEIRLRNRISPIQMNSGSAVSAQLLLALQTVVASSGPVGACVNIVMPTNPVISNTGAIHTPAASRISSTTSSQPDSTRMFIAASLKFARRARQHRVGIARRRGAAA